MKRRVPLHVKILIGLVLGAVLGLVARKATGSTDATFDPGLRAFIDNVAKPIGDLFLALLFMIVVPLIFSALVMGMQELGQAKKFGKVGGLSLLMTIGLSLIACTIALVGVNLIKPGNAIPPAQRQALIAKYEDKAKSDKALETAKKVSDDPPVLGIVPKNPFKEMTRALEGGLLPLMFFALVFGAALAVTPDDKARPLREFFDGLFEVSQRVIGFAMALAPVAVFFLVFKSMAELGTDILGALGVYVLTVLGLLALHLFGVYSLALRFVARRSPLRFFRQMRTTMLTAFATSSSNATLPTALYAAEHEIGLHKEVSNFVLTVGATANQNGTALYEGVTILFLAQLFGKDLTMAEQIRVLGLTVVASIGTAGIPSASLPFIATVLVSLGLPPESIGLILGIDRILDMSRTVLNVTGDMTIAACVDRLATDPTAIPAYAQE